MKKIMEKEMKIIEKYFGPLWLKAKHLNFIRPQLLLGRPCKLVFYVFINCMKFSITQISLFPPLLKNPQWIR